MSNFRIYNRHRYWYLNDMAPTISCKNMKWSVVLQASVLFIGTVISFMMAYSNGSVSIYLPFFSETGAQVPQLCVFSYTVILGSFLGVVVICHRYIVLKYILTPDCPKLLKVNYVSLICGLISMAGLAGVAAIPMSTVLWAHLLAAGIHFIAAMVYIFLQTFINYHSPRLYSKWNRLRIILCLLLLVFLVILMIIFPLSQRTWQEFNTKRASLKTPQDQGFGLLFCSALFEWLLYGTFITYLLTFFFEFHDFQLLISVVPIEDPRNS